MNYIGLMIAIAICLVLLYYHVKQLELAMKISESQEYNCLLKKLSYLTKKSEYELFIESGKKYNIPKYLIKRDYSDFLEKETIPGYVRDFLNEGKEYIVNSKTSPFVFTDWGAS